VDLSNDGEDVSYPRFDGMMPGSHESSPVIETNNMKRRRSMTLYSRQVPHVMGLAVLFCLGCGGPSIKQFDIQPQVLCEGQPAVMHWKADGDLAMTLRLEPPRAGEEECAVEGFDTYAVTLVAHKKGEEALKKVEIGQLRHNAAEPILLATTAVVGSDVIANGDKNVQLWGGYVEVATVAACRHRSIHVQHDNKSVALSPDGAPSAALAGTTLNGSWELRSPLTPEEQQTPALRPKTLQILATVRCRGEKP